MSAVTQLLVKVKGGVIVWAGRTQKYHSSRVVYRFDTGSFFSIRLGIPYWYWSVSILVGISRCARLALSLLYVCCIVSYVHILSGKRDSRQFIIPKSTNRVLLRY